jgi:hypothetical protein
MSGLANAARGETTITIDGAPARLCLTLGALARLETAFETESLSELGERLRRLTAQDLLIVLAALLEGGGAATPQDLMHARIDPGEAARAVARAIELAFDA